MISMKSSVYKTVYIGKEYLKKQLVSILEQLDIEDEIIIYTFTDNQFFP
jgi:glycosyltransferase involved in cell wall biosynthesis